MRVCLPRDSPNSGVLLWFWWDALQGDVKIEALMSERKIYASTMPVDFMETCALFLSQQIQFWQLKEAYFQLVAGEQWTVRVTPRGFALRIRGCSHRGRVGVAGAVVASMFAVGGWVAESLGGVQASDSIARRAAQGHRGGQRTGAGALRSAHPQEGFQERRCLPGMFCPGVGAWRRTRLWAEHGGTDHVNGGNTRTH